ncbi:translation initiation factor IF-2 [Patescibacteria group bacterium]|nr:translation initiation factor IF-2 [Patescibacteria group bacterium]
MVGKKKQDNLISRPPIVVVLGHVDHGKSSLLEAIKDFEITSKESGGITQHVGAYEVEHKRKKITFIDTPGHEAFSAIRARGAQVADVAILVVDSSDTVQPQTKEAINVVKKAEIPMIVVLNKIDKPTADQEKIKRELLKVDIIVESMGGKVPSIEVSAKTKQGIDELLELILLVAEMEGLKADIKVPAEGIIVESYMDCFRGPIATLIVQNGILKRKDIIGTSSALAKIKNLQDFQGKEIEQVYPSQPAVVLGFEKSPWVGEKFKTYVSIDEATANIKEEEEKKELPNTAFTLKDDQKVLNMILKVDVVGSLEAIVDVLKELPQEKIILRILKEEVGDINEADMKLAGICNGQIIGFRVKINPSVLQAMKKDKEKKVKIKTFDVIYNLIQEVRQMMEKTLEPEVSRQDIGKVKTLLVFWGEKNRQIVGGKIIEGEVRKGLKIEVLRDEKKVGEGKIVNLQRNKKDIEKLVKGDECGVLFEGNVKIQEKDILSFYTEERKKGEL